MLKIITYRSTRQQVLILLDSLTIEIIVANAASVVESCNKSLVETCSKLRKESCYDWGLKVLSQQKNLVYTRELNRISLIYTRLVVYTTLYLTYLKCCALSIKSTYIKHIVWHYCFRTFYILPCDMYNSCNITLTPNL